MIVLKDVGVAGMGEIDQGPSASQTHSHSKRELMRRCYVDNLGRGTLRRSRKNNTFIVDRSRHDGRASKAEDSSSLIESRVFDPGHLTAIYQRQRADHHSLLRSRSNDDLVGMTARASMIT